VQTCALPIYGVSTNYRLSDLGFQIKEAKALPVTTELRLDVEIGIFNMVWRTFKLNITTRTEVNVFTFRQTQCQFLNKGSHVRVGLNGTFPLLHTNHVCRYFNPPVLSNRSLARHTPAFTGITFGEVAFLCRQDGAATGDHNTLTLCTGT